MNRADRKRNRIGPALIAFMLAAAGMLGANQPADARIYKWVDKDGNVQYSQKPPPASSGRTASEVDVQGAGTGDTRLDLPPQTRDRYCEAVQQMGVQIARAMRQGASPNRVLTSSHGSESQLLAKQVVGFVFGFKSTRTGPAQIGNMVHSQCQNGTYDRWARKYIEKNFPDGLPGVPPEGESAGHSGTAWAFAGGYVVTNDHVIGNYQDITLVLTGGERLKASVVRRDRDNDLALLTVDDPSRLPRSLPVVTEPLEAGSDVFTIGYPHISVMGKSPKVTRGIVSSEVGLRDDQRFYQISVPVQAGNSGGPLFNMQGEVVGVVTSKLNALALLRRSGDLTQNVNYALKSVLVAELLARIHNESGGRAEPARYQPGPAGAEGSLAELTTRVKDSVMLVISR